MICRLLVVICATVAGLSAGFAQNQKRVALVIGNAEYKVGPLQNPMNDALAVAEALRKKLKFDKVLLRQNLGFEAFRAALLELSREATGAGVGLVYFAGHGTEVNGRNFLIPVDAKLAKAGDLELEAVALDTVVAQLAGVTTLKLVILDACRNNIFPLAGGKRSVTRGLGRIEPEENTLIVYAAKDGTTAEDGVGRKHSPFTEALLAHIATPGLEINFVFRRVRDDVVASTNSVQYPHIYGTLGGKEFYFQFQMTEVEREWARIDKSSIADLDTFVRRHGASTEADYARARIEQLKKSALVTPQPIPPSEPKPFENAADRPFDGVWLANSVATSGCLLKSWNNRVEIRDFAVLFRGQKRGQVNKDGAFTYSIPNSGNPGTFIAYSGKLHEGAGSGTYNVPGGRCAGRIAIKKEAP